MADVYNELGQERGAIDLANEVLTRADSGSQVALRLTGRAPARSVGGLLDGGCDMVNW